MVSSIMHIEVVVVVVVITVIKVNIYLTFNTTVKCLDIEIIVYTYILKSKIKYEK